MQNNRQDIGKRGNPRGSVRNTDRLEAFARKSTTGGADWGGCTPERLSAVVVAITSLGGAVTFGLARDMGAHSMTFMLDGARKTMWYNGGADLDEALDEAIQVLATMVE